MRNISSEKRMYSIQTSISFADIYSLSLHSLANSITLNPSEIATRCFGHKANNKIKGVRSGNLNNPLVLELLGISQNLKSSFERLHPGII